MPDYKEMYLKMFRASEQAIHIMIEAQRECEEMYLSAPDPEVIALPFRGKKHEDKQDGK